MVRKTAGTSPVTASVAIISRIAYTPKTCRPYVFGSFQGTIDRSINECRVNGPCISMSPIGQRCGRCVYGTCRRVHVSLRSSHQALSNGSEVAMVFKTKIGKHSLRRSVALLVLPVAVAVLPAASRAQNDANVSAGLWTWKTSGCPDCHGPFADGNQEDDD